MKAVIAVTLTGLALSGCGLIPEEETFVSPLSENITLEIESVSTVTWYESASFGATFELVSDDNRAIFLELVDSEDELVVDDRTFNLFSQTELQPGDYEMRINPSPFSHDEALVAYRIKDS